MSGSLTLVKEHLDYRRHLWRKELARIEQEGIS